MTDTGATLQSITEGGIAADHIPLPAPRALVAPTLSEKEHNTIKTSVVPFACWRANDMRFEFESSFVRAEISAELSALKELIDRHTLTNEKGEALQRPALSVFGHADPTGNNDFNKALSGRRAQAIYGMLVRDVDLWEDLYSNPLGNDKWEPKAIHAMQTTLGQSLSDHPSSGARKTLFKAYMDRVCTIRDETGQALKLELKKSDFLAQGSDSKGKGDYQGCGEFNPIVMFSDAENKKFSDPKSKKERDDENAPNRRVLIFLFRPGVRIKPNAWPCPRAKEGVAACRKRFWSDADKRRQFQEKRRKFEEDQDTFACRFYDRLANNSPCERGLVTTEIRLYDTAGHFIAEAPFELEIGLRKPVSSKADANGIVLVRDVEVPNRCVIRWGLKPLAGEPVVLSFQLSLFLTIDRTTEEEEAAQRLNNLGYVSGTTLRANVEAFQREYQKRFGLNPDGKLTPETMLALRTVHDKCEDKLR